jgi:hypothetical protein
MARRLEMASGDTSNTLINAVQFGQSLPADSPLRTALFQEMRDPFAKVRWDVVFDWKQLQQLAWGIGSICLLMFVLAVAMPKNFVNSAMRIILPARDIQPLTRTRLEAVFPGNDTVPQGRDMQLSVTLAGEIPKSAWVRFREVGGSWQRVLMEHEAGQPEFTFALKEVKQPIEYQVQAGDVESALYTISVRPRTVLKAAAADLVPPSYMGGEVRQIEVRNALPNVPAGARVKVRFTFNNPVQELKVTAEPEQEIASNPTASGIWAFEFQALGTRMLRVAFKDAAGIPEQFTLPVQISPDTAPKVVISEPAEGKELFAEAGATLVLKIRASDDVGLGGLSLFQSTEEREDAILLQEFPSVAGQKNWEGKASVVLQPKAEETRLAYRVVARDTNDVTGPGVTMSRPIVVNLRSAEKVAEAKKESSQKMMDALGALTALQSLNLDETRALVLKKSPVSPDVLLQRQMKVSEGASQLLSMADGVSGEVREMLEGLLDKEMKQAVFVLRDATAAVGDVLGKGLVRAATLEAAILARLKGAPAAAADDAKRAAVEKVISALEGLLKTQRSIYKDSKEKGAGGAAALVPAQDALAERVPVVRKTFLADSQNPGVGDDDFRQRILKISNLLGELKVYEEMLGASEHLENGRLAEALQLQQSVMVNLAKLVAILNEWQNKEAGEEKEELKEKLSEMNEALRNLVDAQKDVVEKTKEMARKNEFRPDDVAQMDELKKTKDLMKEAIEKMTTDLQAFPDTKAGNEMKDAMLQVFEDVQQEDLEESAAGDIKPTEVAVEKAQSLLDALEKASEIPADMEHWLASKQDNIKALFENFDKTEMPEIPMLPLADAFEDLVGDLLEQQKGLAEQSQDSASNQATADMPTGWEVKDGPMPSFQAKGKSGNQAPQHNEQMGRSTGGREGMSDGEMAATETQMLKGDTPDARRTNDAMQQGQVRDNGEIGQTRATGGGKAGGFSDRNGMEGDAPVRGVQSDKKPADALAVEQAVLAEKTALKTAEASMLYLKSDGLKEVSKLMADAARAMKEGRGGDASSLHQRVIRQLQELKGGVASSEVVARNVSAAATSEERKAKGGDEGAAPAAYKAMVADYFRALNEVK